MEWLREVRRSKSITEKETAQAVGVTQQYYSYIENGKRRPSVAVAKKIAAVLGFDWTKFYEDRSGE